MSHKITLPSNSAFVWSRWTITDSQNKMLKHGVTLSGPQKSLANCSFPIITSSNPIRLLTFTVLIGFMYTGQKCLRHQASLISVYEDCNGVRTNSPFPTLPQKWRNSWRVSQLAKRNYSFHVRPSVRLSAWNNSAPTVRTVMELDIWVFLEICPENSRFIKIWQE
jgi:hypothetical protein